MITRYLILEDGTIFEGRAFGSNEASVGHVVFATGMTGYQETISNPSSAGQMIVMTYPAIGNYGINRDDYESIEPALNGLIAREYCDEPSNFRSGMSLGKLLELKGIPGIDEIDTRHLTLHLRDNGTLRGMITEAGATLDEAKALATLKEYEAPTNLVASVSTQKAYPSPGLGERVVLIDYGMKHGILRELNKRDCDVIVVPHDTDVETIASLFPDGILLSNGPGNPEHLQQQIETIQSLLGKYPIFGIGLGHQLLALATGAKVQKMKHGRYGSNHPVKNLKTNRTELTSQCHGYEIVRESLEGTGMEVTHVALNDESVQGIADESRHAFSVQFHPEGSPGPIDAVGLFDDFIQAIKAVRRKGSHNA
ncbi:carbamoyl phosphate synthase small subunit [Savagea faecisuis]|uniref:Carbamoyl phosphate synthase small chain n=1 Tax=Savagea faecisuis TaxID=1274803 RepID=A0ABW3H1R2_9BACL